MKSKLLILALVSSSIAFAITSNFSESESSLFSSSSNYEENSPAFAKMSSLERKVTKPKDNLQSKDKAIIESNEYELDDSNAELIANRIFWNCTSRTAYCYNSCPTMFQTCRLQTTTVCRGRDFLFTDGSSSCLITF